MKTSLLFACLFGSSVAFGQYLPLGAITTRTEGYVVNAQGDTVRGTVRVTNLLNESPATVVVETPDRGKKKFRGDELLTVVQRIPAFAYVTGSIPRQRKTVVFDRVQHPRQDGKAVLLERLTEPNGRVALYFDATGWKQNLEFTFGNIELATLPEDQSYVLVKAGQPGRLVRRGDLAQLHDEVFGDCPAFVQLVPELKRRDWRQLGFLVAEYNHSCP